MNEMNLVVTGASGRMGKALVRAITNVQGVRLIGALETRGSKAIGRDAGRLANVDELGIEVTDDPLPLFAKADGIIDFTTPAASIEFSAYAAQGHIAHIIGTTGFSQDNEEKIKIAAQHTRIVKSGNMSLGINLLACLVKKAAKSLNMADFDVEILEMHHRDKVDSPSGTALLLAKAVAKGMGVDNIEDSLLINREGYIGPRKSGAIGIGCLRGGTVKGEHSIIFAGNGERIVLSHHAEERDIFARGAIKAALWTRDKKPGLYSMIDVLNLD